MTVLSHQTLPPEFEAAHLRMKIMARTIVKRDAKEYRERLAIVEERIRAAQSGLPLAQHQEGRA